MPVSEELRPTPKGGLAQHGREAMRFSDRQEAVKLNDGKGRASRRVRRPHRSTQQRPPP
jgi:hypothetical protein